MKLIFVSVFFLGCLTCIGQSNKIKYGLSSSLDFNSYSFVDYNSFGGALTYKGVISYSVGIILRQEISKKIFIKSGLYYSSKPFSETIDPYDDPDDPLIISEDFEIIHATKFIDLPVDFQFHLNPERNVVLYPLVGFVNSFSVGYKLKDKDSWERFGNTSEIKYNQYLLGSKIGMGIQVKNAKTILAIEPQIRFYLTEVHESWLTENPLYFGLEASILKL